MGDVDESALVSAAQAGDAQALEELLRLYQPRIYRFGMRLCGHPEDAEEVVQHTLLTLARGIRDFRGDASLSTWLYTLARSHCIKERRRSKFAPTSEESLEGLQVEMPGATMGDDAVHASETATQLRRGLALLEPKSRQVLVLRDVEGLTSREVAEVMGESVAAVKSRLHRARTDLRSHMTGILAPNLGSTTCPDLTLAFSKFLEGELGSDQCAAMQDHLDGCAQCRETCDCLKETLSLCRTAPEPELPADVERAVRRALEAYLATQSCDA